MGEKKRLFVDMDGCLAEWRNITLKITSVEQKDVVVKKLNQLLLSPGYFRSLAPHQNVVDAINELNKEYDVYILSCVIEKEAEPNPRAEKTAWLKEYLPSVEKDHIIFVPDGEDKAKYVGGGITSDDFLLDDYSKNLNDFAKQGGVGIKLLNDVNESNGSWRGNSVSKDSHPSEIVRDLKSLIDGKINSVRHSSPSKNREPLIEITEETIIDL